MAPSEKIIGIDLGTTNTCAAIWLNNEMQMIPNYNNGSHLTPSVVFFGENGSIVVGEDAKNTFANYSNNISGIKRLMGKSFNDKNIQSLLNKQYFYTIISGDDGKATVELDHETAKIRKLPEEISAEILKEIKESASRYLEEDVRKAVITVPAHFDNRQREATKIAAKFAGLDLVTLINEPSAAAIYFATEYKKTQERTALIYDLGGGTFDVSIVKFKSNMMSVVDISGNSFLGGNDIDACLADYLEKKAAIKCNRRQRRRLMKEALIAKEQLSKKQIYKISISAFFGSEENNDDFETEISREEFESVISELVEETIMIADECITNADLNKKDIDDVVLVGGSTRIPKIQNALTKYFDGKELNKTIDPDKAVAMGAAIHAAINSDDPKQKLTHFYVSDIISNSLGVEIRGNVMSFVIKKRTPLPVITFQNYYTTYDNQNRMTFSVFEGESPNTENNTLLGRFIVDGIPPGPRGTQSVRVHFEVQENGILNVSAVSSTKGIREKQLEVTFNIGKLSAKDLREMFVGAEDEFRRIGGDDDVAEDEI